MSVMARRRNPPRYLPRNRTESARIRALEIADGRAKYRAELPPRTVVWSLVRDWPSAIVFALALAVFIVVFVTVFAGHGLPR